MSESFRIDSLGSGISRYSLNKKLDFEHEIYIGGLIFGTFVCYHNLMYIGTSFRRVVCIDRVTDKIVWDYHIRRLTNAVIDSSCAVSPETQSLLVPGGDGYLYCLDLFTGELKWDYYFKDDSHGEELVSSCEGNVLVYKNKVYIGNDNGGFYCIDIVSGKLIWTYQTGMMVWSVAAVIKGPDRVVFGSLDHCVYILDAVTGELVHKYDTGAEVKSSPCVDGDTIVISNSNGRVFKFDHELNVLWSTDFYQEIYSSAAIEASRHAPTVVYIALFEGDIVKLDFETGKEEYRYSTYNNILSSPVVSHDGTVLVGTSAGKVFALSNGPAGFECSVYKVGARAKKNNINSSAFIDYLGSIWVASYNGYVYNTTISKFKRCDDQDANKQRAVKRLRGGNIFKYYRTPHDNMNVSNGSVKVDADNWDAEVFPDAQTVVLMPRRLDHSTSRSNAVVDFVYYPSTSNWVTDRVSFLNNKNKRFRVPLDPLNGKVDPVIQGTLPTSLHLHAYNFVLHEPRILDAYIPMAMHGIAYIIELSGTEGPEGPKVHVTLTPALPKHKEDEDFIPVPGGIAMECDATIHNGIVFGELENFDLSSMGGSLKFDIFKFYIDISNHKGVKGDFYACVNALGIKGNGHDHSFPFRILHHLVDSGLNVKAFGEFDCIVG